MADASETGAHVRPVVVLVAHDNPRHLRRLIAALAPLPVLLHVDATAPDDVHRAMVDGLPDRVRLLPRLRAGWGHVNVLVAELQGYRVGLATTGATHFVLLTGADYPLASVDRILATLGAHPDASVMESSTMPHAPWGRLQGYDRFWFVQRAWNRRRLVLPVPRPVPWGLTPAGGPQTKIITRAHAQHLLRVWDAEPRLARYFRTCWTPDEVAIPTLFATDRFGFAEHGDLLTEQHPWFIDWGTTPSPNPRWLDASDLPALRRASRREGFPALFARKFNHNSAAVCDRIDDEVRTA